MERPADDYEILIVSVLEWSTETNPNRVSNQQGLAVPNSCQNSGSASVPYRNRTVVMGDSPEKKTIWFNHSIQCQIQFRFDLANGLTFLLLKEMMELCGPDK